MAKPNVFSTQGQIQDFLREGASQADMTVFQSQKSAEELPNMHASANWISWQSTTGLLTALIEYLTVLLSILIFLQSRCMAGHNRHLVGSAWPTLCYVTAHPLDWPLNLFLFVRCSYKYNWPKADKN